MIYVAGMHCVCVNIRLFHCYAKFIKCDTKQPENKMRQIDYYGKAIEK